MHIRVKARAYRNGANNFVLYVVQKLLPTQKFVLISPKEGPMRADFEELGVAVFIMDPTDNEKFLDALEAMLIELGIHVLLCNTIMRCDVVCLAARMNLACAWVSSLTTHQILVHYFVHFR